MTREEFESLKKRVEIAADLFGKMDSLERTIASFRKCYIIAHNGDNVREGSVRIKEQEAVRTIVLEQLNNEFKDITQKVAEF